MTLLLGPTDAGHFRVKVGRYGDRWYVDPLAACPIAPAAPDWQAPSVSWSKPPFANRYVTMKAIANMPDGEWSRLAKESADARYEAVKSWDKMAGRVNMDRGSIVHKWAEDRLLGRRELFADPSRWAAGALEQADKFRPALDSFFDTHQPEAFAVEAVCLHRDLNGVGYGGTMDALVWIDGDLWAIDWKSRNSDHAAYPEEAAQGGAYIGAQYMIVAGPDGNPVRVRIPDVAGVLIVSIREDGFRAYPIEASKAIGLYHEMHRWAVAQMGHSELIGKPWAPKIAAAEASGAQTQPLPPQDRRQQLRDRYALLDDAGKLAFAELAPGDDLDKIEAALNTVDAFTATVIPPLTVTDIPRTPVAPPEDPDGPVVLLDQRNKLNDRYKRLGEEQRAQVDVIRRVLPEVKTTPDGQPRMRAFLIHAAAVAWAENIGNWADWEDLVSAAGDGTHITDFTLEQARSLNDMATALAAA